MTTDYDQQLQPEEPSTLGSFVLAIAQTIEELGFNSKSVLAAANLEIVDDFKHSRVAIKRLVKIWRMGVDVTSNDALGIAVAQRMRPITFDALSMSLYASEDLISALQRFSRYHEMVSDALAMSIEIDNSSVTLILENFFPPRAEEGLDCAIATPLHFCREIAREEIIPTKVQFMRGKPERIEDFQRFFQCPIEFNANRNAIIFNKDVLVRKLPGNNSVSNYLEGLAGKYVSGRKKGESLSQAYSFIIINLSSGKVSQESLAEFFSCSTRQLQRKLKEESTSFRELLDKIRMDLSEEYIRVKKYSIAETAYLLGYSDPNTFSRAFKNWTGFSPGEYRKRLDG